MRSSFARRSASAARAWEAAASGRAERLLEILDPLRPFLVPDGERIAFVGQRRMVAAQALVRLGQGLELPLRFEMGDFRALDLLEGLIDRGQRIVELGTDDFDVPERELDGVEVSAQAFVAPADRIESARDLQRLRRRLAARARTAGGERAQTLDDGRRPGRSLVPRFVGNVGGL